MIKILGILIQNKRYGLVRLLLTYVAQDLLRVYNALLTTHSAMQCFHQTNRLFFNWLRSFGELSADVLLVHVKISLLMAKSDWTFNNEAAKCISDTIGRLCVVNYLEGPAELIFADSGTY